MERAFAELIRRLHRRYEIVVVSSEVGEDLRDLVEWRRVPVPRRPIPLRFSLFYLLGAARLAAANADIVHTLGAIVPNAAHVATVQFCHAGFVEAVGHLAPPSAPPVRRINTALTRVLCLLAERWAYRGSRVRWLAPVSNGVAAELSRHYPGVPLQVTPNGVDRERFAPDRRRRTEVRSALGLEEHDFLAIFVGGDWDRKGLELAVRGVAGASPRCERALRLVVVGQGDDRRFRMLARDLGIDGQVIFVGPRRDTERFYAAADAFLFPSAYEAFPLVALEASASGLPIVASAVNGIAELLADGQAGIVVARDPDAIADALVSIAAAPHRRRAMGAAALERSAAFTWDRSAAAVESVYRSLPLPAVPVREGVAS
jgi:glycosyltransferase involved in cell wall biosynthesis